MENETDILKMSLENRFKKFLMAGCEYTIIALGILEVLVLLDYEVKLSMGGYLVEIHEY